MTLSNLLMTAYVNRASEAGKGVWDILEKVAREHVTEELYKDAANLLDTNTIVTDDNEYHRGMVELIMEWNGMGSDDKEEIAAEISKRTGLHQITSADFAPLPTGGDLYIGPLDAAIKFIKGPNASEVEEGVLPNGMYNVKLDGGNVWGTADTREMAWRYAIGAEMGPIDDEFEPFFLTD